MADPSESELLHLVDRAERHVLLPREAARLRDGIRTLAARPQPARSPHRPEGEPMSDRYPDPPPPPGTVLADLVATAEFIEHMASRDSGELEAARAAAWGEADETTEEPQP